MKLRKFWAVGGRAPGAPPVNPATASATSGLRSFFPPFSHFWCSEFFSTIRRALNSSHLLVAKHVVCERLSVMQGLQEYGLGNILLKIPWVPPRKYFRNVGLDRKCRFGQILAQTPPTPPRIIQILTDLGTLGWVDEDHPPTSPKHSDLDRSWHFGLSWCGPSPSSPKHSDLDRSWNLGWVDEDHPPYQKHSDLDRSWHFGLSWCEPAPLPTSRVRFGQILALWVELVWTTPHPPKTFRFGQILALWVELVWTTPQPPDSDLDRSWHFGLSWYGPPPTSKNIQILTDLGTLGWVGGGPPPFQPRDSDLDRSWHFGLRWYGPHPTSKNIQIWTDLGTLGWVGVAVEISSNSDNIPDNPVGKYFLN